MRKHIHLCNLWKSFELERYVKTITGEVITLLYSFFLSACLHWCGEDYQKKCMISLHSSHNVYRYQIIPVAGCNKAMARYCFCTTL